MWRRGDGRGPSTVGSKGFVSLAVLGVLLVAAVAVTIGTGNQRAIVDVLDGRTWLSSSQKGEMALVNGAAARTEVRLRVKGAEGKALTIAQNGRYLVFSGGDGDVSSVDLSDFTVTDTTRFSGGRDLKVVLGARSAFVVNVRTGVVQAVDPTTTAPIGTRLELGGRLSVGGIGKGDRLWLAQVSTGELLPVTRSRAGARAGDRLKVAQSGQVLHVTLVGETPVVVNETLGLATWVDGTTLGRPIDLRVRRGTRLAVPTDSADGLVPVAVGARNTLLLIGPAGARSIRLGSGRARLGPPVRFASKTYVPDLGAGEVVEVGDAGRVLRRIPVPGGRGGFELFADDAHLWANAARSDTAANVDRHGGVRLIEKYDKDALLKKPESSPDAPPDAPPDPAKPVPTPGATPLPARRPGGGTGPPPPVVTPPAPTPPSGPGVPQPPATAPGVPGSPTASPGNRSLTLRFAVPAANGSPIRSYEVVWEGDKGGGGHKAVGAAVASPDGASGSIDVDGLKNGESYVVTVSASNEVGAGPAASAPPVTPTNRVPSAPASVDAQANGDGTLTVTWAEGDGEGNEVVGYVVESDGVPVVDPSADSNLDRTVTVAAADIGVALGDEASFAVRTVSSVAGERVESDPSDVVGRARPYTAPGAPGTPSVTKLTADTVTIGWAAPSSDNGRPVTGYRVLDGGGAEVANTDGALAADVGLGGDVTLTVVAVNDAGAGSPSGSLAVSRPRAPIGALQGSPSVSLQRITVGWSVDDGGFGLASCTISVGSQSQGCSAGTGSSAFEMGQWGAGYDIRITATNTFGQSFDQSIGSASTWSVQNYSLWNTGFRTIDIPVNFRAGPGTNHGIVSSGHLPPTTIPIVCQGRGTRVDLNPASPTGVTSDVWDRMADGSWVADIYVNTPGSANSTTTGGIPSC